MIERCSVLAANSDFDDFIDSGNSCCGFVGIVGFVGISRAGIVIWHTVIYIWY